MANQSMSLSKADAEDYTLLAENLRARGAVVRQRHYRGKAVDELKEIAAGVAALDDQQIALLVFALAVVEDV